MKTGGGKKKGSAFERKIAKDIVKAFKHKGIKQRECWRSVLSGGHVISSGDLIMSRRLEKLFPFSVECKHRKKIRWENFLLRKKSEEASWIDQACEGAKKRKGLVPLLVMKANNFPILVLYPHRSIHPKVKLFDKEGRCWSMMKWTKFLMRNTKGVIV